MMHGQENIKLRKFTYTNTLLCVLLFLKIVSCTNLNERFLRNTQTFLDPTLIASKSAAVFSPSFFE